MTLVPAQIVFEGFADIVILAGKTGFTVIVIADEVAGLLVTQVKAEDITHLIASLFTRVLEEKVVFVAPEIFVSLNVKDTPVL